MPTATGHKQPPVDVFPAGPIVSFDRVSKQFPTTPPVQALSDVSFTVGAGEHVAILGPSGSGKSTMLNILGLLDRPSSGSYTLNHIDVATLKDHQLAEVRASEIGFVFQSFQLINHRSIEENVALAEIYQDRSAAGRNQRACALLHRVGLGHRIGFTPSTLSGGERQRVALARALASQPSLLLCDEPTGNLDTKTAGSVLELIDSIRSPTMSIVTITHDPGVACRADRTIELVDGRHTGTPSWAG